MTPCSSSQTVASLGLSDSGLALIARAVRRVLAFVFVVTVVPSLCTPSFTAHQAWPLSQQGSLYLTMCTGERYRNVLGSGISCAGERYEWLRWDVLASGLNVLASGGRFGLRMFWEAAPTVFYACVGSPSSSLKIDAESLQMNATLSECLGSHSELLDPAPLARVGCSQQGSSSNAEVRPARLDRCCGLTSGGDNSRLADEPFSKEQIGGDHRERLARHGNSYLAIHDLTLARHLPNGRDESVLAEPSNGAPHLATCPANLGRYSFLRDPGDSVFVGVPCQGTEYDEIVWRKHLDCCAHDASRPTLHGWRSTWSTTDITSRCASVNGRVDEDARNSE